MAFLNCRKEALASISISREKLLTSSLTSLNLYTILYSFLYCDFYIAKLIYFTIDAK